MQPLNLNDIKKYVEDNIGTFHSKKSKGLSNLKLKEILKRKKIGRASCRERV